MLFSILIPSWNNLAYLKNCIRSLKMHSVYQHQIVVMANEGSDEMREWLLKEDIDHVHSPVNIGICHGLNAAATLAKTDYILYLNDDMYVLPEWDTIFKTTINHIGHQRFMLSATLIEPVYTGNPCVIVSDFGDDLEFFDESGLLAAYEKLKKADWNGSSWPPNLLPRQLWEEVGGMSPEFSPGMYSDPDLSMKLWQKGVRHFQGLALSRVYHFGSKSTRRLGKNTGRKIFLKKWKITARQFYKYYLKMGSDFKGPLPDMRLPLWQQAMAVLKQFR